MTKANTQKPKRKKVPDRVGGIDVSHITTPEAFIKTFGCDRIYSTKSLPASKKGECMQAVAGAMADLADVLGLPLKAMGLSRKHFYRGSAHEWSQTTEDLWTYEYGLGIDLLSESFRNAGAWYRENDIQIKLYPKKSRGCFAHEWFHALDDCRFDHVFKTEIPSEKASGIAKDFAILIEEIKKNRAPIMLRVVLADVLSEHVEELSHDFQIELIESAEKGSHAIALAKENFQKMSINLNRVRKKIERLKKGKESLFFLRADTSENNEYYTDPRELAARAFEGYVARKLKKAGRVNRFLVGEWVDPEGDYLMDSVYPQLQEEKDAIDAHFDKMFEKIRKMVQE